MKTTEPFIVRGHALCTMCAEDVAPEIVWQRERKNNRILRHNENSVPHSKFPGKHEYQ
jgi:hypothetical protein